MKKSVFAFSILVVLAILFYPQAEVISNSTGSPGGKSGAPGDNTCVQCHSSFALNSGSAIVNITSTIPASGYVPGSTYTITSSAAQSGVNKYGFEVHEALGSILITNSTTTKHVGIGSNRITHEAAGTTVSVNSISWSFNWVAPATGSGNATFYGAFVAANYPSGNSNDYVYTTTLVVSENIPVAGCTDSTALNYNVLATIDDGSCTYPLIPLVYENLFFSEYGEGSSDNKYFEIYNPTSSTVDLTNYAFARVSNAPTNIGVYEYWVNFDSGAVILPYDVYIVRESGQSNSIVDSIILAAADMDYPYMSNGDDGFALVYGNEPSSPIAPDSVTYAVLDWLGDWNGDPGTAWNVAGVTNATKDHTLVRKCSIIQGDTSWVNAAGTSTLNSSWIVYPNNYWNNLGTHTTGSLSTSNSYTICAGDSITVGSHHYTVTGTYIDTLVSSASCDSIITTQLIVNPTLTFTNNQTICSGASISVGSNNYTTAGTYIDTLVNSTSCDSIVTTHLIVNPTLTFTNNQTICTGGSINVGSNNYTVTGTYIDTLVSSTSCDSIITTHLTVSTTINITNNHSICLGDSIVVNSNVYATTGVYIDSLISLLGCDSVITTHLIVNLAITFTNNQTICAGNSITVGLHTYDSSGIYVDVLSTLFGCDSTVTTNLVVLPTATTTTTNYTICDGDSIIVNSNTYTTTGIYMDTLVNTVGCDSILITHLIVSPVITHINNQTICDGDSVTVGSSVYFALGSYSDVFVAGNGCDSSVTTNLTFYQSPTLQIGSAPSPAEICFGDTILLEASPGFVSYAWNNGMTGQIIYDNPTTDTWYMVEAVDANGCVVKEDINVYVDSCITSVNETSQQEKQLLKIIDILGKEATPKQKGIMFYIYSDGTVEKKLLID